jgi:predicted N-acyltransferase
LSLTVHVHDTVADIGREAWDACAAPSGDPFVSFAFLDACEASGSAVPREGWAGRHLSLVDEAGRVLGVMPLWLKGHSQGEYVFDHSWADAYDRAGGRYYPKLLAAVPFTPVTGPRFLAHPDADAATVRQALLQGALALTERLGLSSLHVTFPTRDDWEAMGAAGLLKRQDMQYVWRNGGYQTFDDFLSALSSSRRKTIRRERREANAGLDIRVLTGAEIEEAHWDAMGQAGLLRRQDIQYVWRNGGYAAFDDFLSALSSNRRKTIRRERREAQAGLDIRVLTGADIRESHWDAFFAFYMDTGERKWGRPYLTRDFFSRIGATLADRIALVMAFRDGTPIAGALNLIGRDALYGRQWGALDDVPFLHFELCYYRAIEFAIERGLSRVEAGAQGDHKIARGYLPSPVYSAHFITDPALREPVARYLDGERPAVEAEMHAMTDALSPFRET